MSDYAFIFRNEGELKQGINRTAASARDAADDDDDRQVERRSTPTSGLLETEFLMDISMR